MSTAYNCPNCSSPDTRKLSVIHTSGTATSLGLGLAGGHLAIGAAKSGTELAASVAPPTFSDPAKVPHPFLVGGHGGAPGLGCLLGFVLGGGIPAIIAAVAGGSEDLSMGLMWLAGIGFALVGWGLGKRWWLSAHDTEIRAAKVSYEASLAKWNNTFMCLRCGSTFEVANSAADGWHT